MIMSEQTDFKTIVDQLERFVETTFYWVQHMLSMLADFERRAGFTLWDEWYLYRSLKCLLYDFKRIIDEVRDSSCQSDDEAFAILSQALNAYRPETTGWFDEYESPGSYAACTLFQLFILEAVNERTAIDIKRLINLYHRQHAATQHIHALIDALKKAKF